MGEIIENSSLESDRPENFLSFRIDISKDRSSKWQSGLKKLKMVQSERKFHHKNANIKLAAPNLALVPHGIEKNDGWLAGWLVRCGWVSENTLHEKASN